MNGGHCNICGQLITDASGCWILHMRDHGINQMPSERIRICAWRKDELDKAIEDLSKRQVEERKKWR